MLTILRSSTMVVPAKEWQVVTSTTSMILNVGNNSHVSWQRDTMGRSRPRPITLASLAASSRQHTIFRTSAPALEDAVCPLNCGLLNHALDDTRALGAYLESSHGTISEGEPILRPPSTNLSVWRRSRNGTRQPTPPVAPLRKRHDMDAPSLNPRTLGTAAATTPPGAAAKNWNPSFNYMC